MLICNWKSGRGRCSYHGSLLSVHVNTRVSNGHRRLLICSLAICRYWWLSPIITDIECACKWEVFSISCADCWCSLATYHYVSLCSAKLVGWLIDNWTYRTPLCRFHSLPLATKQRERSMHAFDNEEHKVRIFSKWHSRYDCRITETSTFVETVNPRFKGWLFKSLLIVSFLAFPEETIVESRKLVSMYDMWNLTLTRRGSWILYSEQLRFWESEKKQGKQ